MRPTVLRPDFCEDRITPSGGLDPTFGTAGVVATALAGTNDFAYAVAVQPDGKILAAGAINNPAAAPYVQDAVLIRYNPDGSLDGTFGTGGRVVFGTTSSEERWNAIAVQPDGKILVAGGIGDNTGFDFLVVRYNANGTPDTFFGTGGKTTVDFGTSADFANALAVLPDGTIYAVGDGNQGALPAVAVARLQADGLLDTTYNGTGKVQARFQPGGQSNAAAAAVQPDGKLVVAGFWSESGVGNDAALGRFNPDGTWDATFGAGGKALVDFGGNFEFFTDLAVQADGRIVGVGRQDANPVSGTDSQFALARVTAAGALDPTFGTGGKVLTNMGGTDQVSAVVIQANGKIVAAGGAGGGGGTTSQIALARYNTDGALDPTFGDGGRVLTQANGSAINDAQAAALAPGGKIVIAGGSKQADFDITLARYLTNDPPTASAGGPYTVRAGDALALTAAGSADADGDALTFTWDLNGDGVFGDATGPAPVVSGAALAALTPPAADAGLVRVRVSDGVNPPVVSPAAALTITPAPAPEPDPALGPVRPVVVGGAGDGTVRLVTPGGGTAAVSAFDAGATVRTASADVNGDGVADVIAVTGAGGETRMAVVSGKDGGVLLPPTVVYAGENFTFGGYVAAGDIDGDGRAEWVVTPELRGGPRVQIFRLSAGGGLLRVANFFGIGDPSFRDGCRAALGDVNGDGVLDVFVTAAFNGGPRTALFNGADVLTAAAAGRDPLKLISDFFAAPDGTDAGRGGRSIAAGDLDGDGVADLIVTGDNLLGSGNRITVYSGASLAAGKVPGAGAAVLADFTVSGFDPTALASVGLTNADGDARADLAVGSGPKQAARVKVYLGSKVGGSGEPAAFADLAPFDGAVLADGVFVG